MIFSAFLHVDCQRFCRHQPKVLACYSWRRSRHVGVRTVIIALLASRLSPLQRRTFARLSVNVTAAWLGTRLLVAAVAENSVLVLPVVDSERHDL